MSIVCSFCFSYIEPIFIVCPTLHEYLTLKHCASKSTTSQYLFHHYPAKQLASWYTHLEEFKLVPIDGTIGGRCCSTALVGNATQIFYQLKWCTVGQVGHREHCHMSHKMVKQISVSYEWFRWPWVLFIFVVLEILLCYSTYVRHELSKSNQIKSIFLSSRTWGGVALSPEQEAHVSNSREFWIELEFRSVGFWGEGKTGRPAAKWT